MRQKGNCQITLPMPSLSTPVVLPATLMAVFILGYSTNQGSSIAQNNRAGGSNFVSPLPFRGNQSVRWRVQVVTTPIGS